MVNRFVLPTGDIVPKSETSRHHAWWYEYEYQIGSYKRLRSLGGFILRMYNPIHVELHANVEPPIKPSPPLVRNLIDQQRRHPAQTHPYEKFIESVSYLGYLTTFGESQQVREEAEQLKENFKDQLYFIDRGRVEWHGTRA